MRILDRILLSAVQQTNPENYITVPLHLTEDGKKSHHQTSGLRSQSISSRQVCEQFSVALDQMTANPSTGCHSFSSWTKSNSFEKQGVRGVEKCLYGSAAGIFAPQR